MNPVNNFFTDLLDTLISSNATSLVLSADRRPSMMFGSTFRPLDYDGVIDGDEMLYDLEALGIKGLRKVTDIATVPFTYIRDDGQSPVEFVIEYGYPNQRFMMEVTYKQVAP